MIRSGLPGGHVQSRSAIRGGDGALAGEIVCGIVSAGQPRADEQSDGEERRQQPATSEAMQDHDLFSLGGRADPVNCGRAGRPVPWDRAKLDP